MDVWCMGNKKRARKKENNLAYTHQMLCKVEWQRPHNDPEFVELKFAINSYRLGYIGMD